MELMEVVDGRSVDGQELLHGTHGSRGWNVRGWSWICFMELVEVVEGRCVYGHEHASWNSWKSWKEGGKGVFQPIPEGCQVDCRTLLLKF
jgi:hypothetical protein